MVPYCCLPLSLTDLAVYRTSGYFANCYLRNSFSLPSTIHCPCTTFATILFLRCLLGKLDSEDEVLETKAVHLVAGSDGVVAVEVADEGKSLGEARLAVLGQEDALDTAKPLKQVTQLALLRHLRHLRFVLVSE